MSRTALRSLAISALLVMAGCGDQPRKVSTFTAPTGTPASNHAPVIDSLDLEPAFGVAGLTQFSFNASATDPDGDPLTYSWNVAGAEFSGTSGVTTIAADGEATLQLTVTDSTGESVAETRTVRVASMTGEWLVTSGPLAGASLQLTQSASGLVTGGFNLPGKASGGTDPDEPGQITSSARLTLRLKLANDDFTITGTLDGNGRTVSGTVQGSSFDGEPFTMIKPFDQGRRPCVPKRRFEC